jgi:hypothetical protein
MIGSKKIRLLITVGLVLSVGIVAVIIYNMQTKTFVKEDKGKVDTAKNGSPKMITIEKDPEVDKKQVIRNKITKYVTAYTNGFDKGAFGGISNLKIKIRNTSAYVIDDVEIQVTYIQANGKVFKTETVYCRDINHNSSTVIEGPDAGRGAEVSVKILAINSKQLGLCYLAGQPGEDPEDPYRCQ